MQKVDHELALKNAFASARMEGYTVTAETERSCKRLLAGEVTADALVAELLKKTARRQGDGYGIQP